MRSWLQGIPIPAIIVDDRTTTHWARANGVDRLRTGQGMYAVVGGKQRLEAAKTWFDGELDVPTTWFEDRDVEEVTQTDDGPYVTVDQLTERGQTRMELGVAPMPMSRAQVESIEVGREVCAHPTEGTTTPQS